MSLGTVASEKLSEIASRTAEERANVEERLAAIAPGELVLCARYGAVEDKHPNRFVLVEFNKHELSHQFIGTDAIVLYPVRKGSRMPPLAVKGEHYLCSKICRPDIPGDTYSVSVPSWAKSGEFHVGLDKILDVLESTPGYAPHAATLRAVNP